MEDRTLSHPVLQEELSDPKNGGSAHKHLKQQVRTDTTGDEPIHEPVISGGAEPV